MESSAAARSRSAARSRAEEVQQHHRALALPEVSADLLAVERLVGLQVEQVVVDLEGDAGRNPSSISGCRSSPQRGQRAGRPPADHADPERRDHRVPARLLVRHPHVVAVAEVEALLGDPAELDGLALDRLAGHPLDLAEHQQRLAHADRLRVPEQEVEREHVGRVADVDRHGHAVRLEQRHLPAPELATRPRRRRARGTRCGRARARPPSAAPGRCGRRRIGTRRGRSPAGGPCPRGTDSRRAGRRAARIRSDGRSSNSASRTPSTSARASARTRATTSDSSMPLCSCRPLPRTRAEHLQRAAAAQGVRRATPTGLTGRAG